MALQRVPNMLVSTPQLLNQMSGIGTQTVDAAGESCAIVGYVALENGSDSTKTISSSGGKIYYRTAGAVTFANASTNLRVGIQDVSASTGLEDNTFDVRADLVGGTDTITTNAYMSAAMETGSKTITHGDLIAIVIEMTARGGADSIILGKSQHTSSNHANIPYGTSDSGTLAKSDTMLASWIQFDDGTMGWIMGGPDPGLGRTSVNFNSTSTPDEYAVCFTPNFTCEIDAVGVDLSDIDNADAYDVRLYSDPLGTPSLVLTINPDTDINNQVASNQGAAFWAITPTTLTTGTTYAIAIRPTTANNFTIGYIDLLTGNDKLKTCTLFGSTLKLATRTDTTGAFSVLQTYYQPYLFLRISKLDDGVQTGGGGFAGIIGGV